MSAIDKPKYIKPESICIGDTIIVRNEMQDSVVSYTGTVNTRHHYSHTTEYATAQGVVLLACHADGTTAPPNCTITLVNRKANEHPVLAGYLELV